MKTRFAFMFLVKSLITISMGCYSNEEPDTALWHWEKVNEISHNKSTIEDSVSLHFLKSNGEESQFLVKNHLPQTIWYLHEKGRPFVDTYSLTDTGWTMTRGPFCLTMAKYKAIPSRSQRPISVYLPQDSAPQKIALWVYFDKEHYMIDRTDIESDIIRLKQQSIVQDQSNSIQ